MTEKAIRAFQKAVSQNSLEASLFFLLASAEARLEKLALYTGKVLADPAPNPLSHFQKAIELAPNTAQYHIALAEYLYDQNRLSLLEKMIRDLGRIYPDSYYRIQDEPFWSKSMAPALISGLEKATLHSITAKSAHEVLSRILERQSRFQEAVFHFQKSLELKAEIGTHDLIRLGSLHLSEGTSEKAIQAFIEALISSKNKNESIKNIYWTYERLKKFEAFLAFFKAAKAKGLFFPRDDLYAARAQLRLNNLDNAKEILLPLSRQHPSGEAYSLLAEISEKEKDWDSMERFIQKATVQDPGNYWNHYKFSEVLNRKNKLDEAEKEADLAIMNSDESRPWLFSHRAWIRWQKKDYPNAVEDWDKAATYDPENPDYPNWIGDVYHKMGRWDDALRFYRQALILDPKNIKLHEKHDSLLKNLQRIRN